MVYSRRISLADLGYACMGCRSTDKHQIINQLVIEGQGEVDEASLRSAIALVTESTPACRMVIRGKWGLKYWCADGPMPTLRVVTSDWNGEYSEDADFLDTAMDVFNGPVTEIIQVVSSKTYFVFRVHHAVMDGVATLEFAQNFFRALKGEVPETIQADTIAEDLEVRKVSKSRSKLKPESKRRVLPEALTPLGQVPQEGKRGRERIWHRVSLAHPLPFHDLMILPKIMVELASIARRNAMDAEKGDGVGGHGTNNVRMHVPVNLRRHIKSENVVAKKVAANLVGQMVLDIDEEESGRSLAKKFNAKLAENDEVANKAGICMVNFIRWIPFGLLERLAKQVINRKIRQRKKYVFSGTVSSIGYVDLDDYSTQSFLANSVFGIPIPVVSSPLFAAVCSNRNGTEILLGANVLMAGNDRLLNLGEELKFRLSGRSGSSGSSGN